MNMDSGNSGSLQSSSGGDEEYDSRASDNIFMTPHPPPHARFISNPPPPQRPPPQPLFDPLSNYVQLFQNPNSLILNQNINWPRTTSLRSDPNSSTNHDTINPMLSIPSFQTPAAAAVGEDNHNIGIARAERNQNQTAARNPKKRSRASRRAPTTVLTTDTTNFRAMVQEFTGIPAQPFNNSPFSRSRLDLFGARSTALEAAKPPPPPYVCRPFVLKVQSPPPFLVSPASLCSSLLSSTAIDATAASCAANDISSQNPNLFDVQNPLLSSLLQSNPFSSSSVTASKTHNLSSFNIPTNDIKIGNLEEFGLSDGNHVSAAINGLPNLISPDQILAQTDDDDDDNNTNDNNTEIWRSSGVSPDEDDEYQGRMKRINGDYSFSKSTMNEKTNNTASPSNFQGENVPENIAARGEGIVESWFCSSKYK